MDKQQEIKIELLTSDLQHARTKAENTIAKTMITECETCNQSIKETMDKNEADKTYIEVEAYNCKECDFKSNWMASMKDHKKRRNKTRNKG